ncbi:inhibitor of growth protein 1 [Drosophila grimshawi]|uniref:Inhibitor of growth protein n=1 Tax=Drosophila grimshawi TaxID=7222 RepID=B4JUG7_DROGR|nr:inhibitor of growth protein 1 [Drosophila grimshawi]EDV91137.1 GH15818 [Drosophila grimshawi]
MIASESEAINSATYVDNYLDSVENLPDDVQRQLSRIRDIDVQYRGLIRDVDHYYDLYVLHLNSPDSQRRCRSITRMHQSLIQAQELGDEKMQIVNHLQEIIDAKVRQLDTDQQNLDLKEEREQRYILLDDSPASKLQRLQSPMCDQGNSAGNNVLNSTGLSASNAANSVAKEHYGALSYGAVIAVAATGVGLSGNGGGGGGSTPTYDRGSHLTSSANNGFNGTFCGSNSSDLQRSGSKRSRRRNESAPNNGSSNEMGGNESNSANEAGSSGNGNSERKSVMTGGALGQRKSHVQLVGSGVGAGGGVVTAGGSGSGGAGGGGGGVGGAGNVGGGGGSNSGKKKKRKVRGAGASNTAANAREETPPPEPIDPDEPTYCVCNQISFGEMILCDNDLCPIEWFHFSCVSLVLKPKGRWFCPNCRGERPNVMKPKAQFLKELERYNKEKEEKT